MSLKIEDQIILRAPISRVWEEFAPDRLAQWYKGRSHIQFELPPRERFVATGNFQLILRNGKYQELLQASTRTIFEAWFFQWEDSDGWQVCWKLEPVENFQCTKLTVSDQSRANHSAVRYLGKWIARPWAKRRYNSSLKTLKKLLTTTLVQSPS